MSVSVAENKIVCYNVDNAITNAELMGPGPRWKKGPEPHPRFRRLWISGRQRVSTNSHADCMKLVGCFREYFSVTEAYKMFPN